MKILLIALLLIASPAYAQHKTIAVPLGQTAKHVPLTQDEIKQKQDKEALYKQRMKQKRKAEKKAALDKKLPPYAEKIIDVLTPEQRQALPDDIKLLYQQRKTQ